MATGGQVSAGGGVDILGLLQLLGGQKGSTTSSADTSALQSVLAQLQAAGQDPSALLASIFQQAQGALPGLQQKMSSASGARVSGNSGVSGILQQLLKDTTLAAQKQFADQQNQNLATQANVAGGIARSTQSTKTTQGTNLGQLGTILGVAQLASKLGDVDKIKNLFSGTSGAATTGGTAPTVGGFGDSLGSPMTLGGSQGSFDVANGLFDGASGSFGGLDLLGGLSGSITGDLGANAITDTASYADLLPTDFIPDFSSIFGFADGGLVGRDGKKIAHYADGGFVQTAGGSRRSANPILDLAGPMTSSVRSAVQLFGPQQKLQQSGTSGLSGNESGGGSTGQTSAATSASLGMSPGATAGVNAGIGALGLALGMATGIPGLNAMAQALGVPSPTMAQVATNLGLATGLGQGETTGGFNALGQATGMDNANGFSGLNAAVGVGEGSGQAGSSGDGLGGGDAAAGYADGGSVEGKKGTDKVPAMLTHGEYVLSKDTVQAIGPNFLDFLQAAYHTPVTNSMGTDNPEAAEDTEADSEHLQPPRK